MLVLSRKREESIRIGGDVVVAVLEIHGRRVRLGVEAPAQLRVLRSELTTAVARPPDRMSQPIVAQNKVHEFAQRLNR